MAEGGELETLVYCLGPVGGLNNPVMTSGLYYTSKYDYTTKGYERYITEAKNVIKFHRMVISYFLESVKPEYEDPLAFIDEETEENLKSSIHKMKKEWGVMFQVHQKALRETLRKKAAEHSSGTPKQAPAEEYSDDSSSSSSAKLLKLDPEAALETGGVKDDEGSLRASGDESLEAAAGVVGVPVESFDFPESIFLRKAKEFGQILKAEFLKLKSRLGKALDRLPCDDTVRDLKGFTLLKMKKFAKWKYDLKTAEYLVSELESIFSGLDLDFHERKENEKRLTDWMFFDDGKRDRRYYHRLLIPMEVTGSIDEVSAILCKKMRRWGKINNSLADRLPYERKIYGKKMKLWRKEVLYGRPLENLKVHPESIDSIDTLCNVDDMPED